MNSHEGEVPPKNIYSFPVAEANALRLQLNLPAKSDDQIAKGLVSVSGSKNATTGKRVTYARKVRNLFCALSLELNERGLLAPRFRRAMRPSWQSAIPDSEKDLHNDRQVIDLHWLHCRKSGKTLGKDEYCTLLVATDFNFDSASRFAAENDRSDTKARWLKLGDYVAWELAAIETKYRRERFSTLMHGKYRDEKRDMYGMTEVQSALATAAAKRKGNEDLVEGWATLWLVDRLLGNKATPTIRSQLWALATGKKIVPDPSFTTRTLLQVLAKIALYRPGVLIAA